MASNLYFVAILTPEEVSRDITGIKNYIAQRYHSAAALKSPPHITLAPPFHMEKARESELLQVMDEFARGRSAFDCEASGYSAFAPRVIFVDILPNKPLENLYWALNQHLENALSLKNQAARFPSFSPHITVAFKDLTPKNFYRAWEEFKNKKIHHHFGVNALAVLRHNGHSWQTIHHSRLGASPTA